MRLPSLPSTDFFDTVGGLPTHPLVVHLSVVMLPLATLGLLAIICVPAWRRSYGWLTIAGLATGAAGAVLAAQTGEALAQQVGLPQDHARWGDLLEKAALVLLAIAIVWFLLQRRNASPNTPPVLYPLAQAISAILSIIMSIGVLTLTVVVGHSGAAAVWEGRTTATTPSVEAPARVTSPSAPGALGNPAPAASASSAHSRAITITEVQQHATSASCWSVVDGGVYDLTTWIFLHPGGPTAIEALCGKDASVAFHDQHGNQEGPNTALAEFRIGTLSQ